MSHRCINAFVTDSRTVAGGTLVDDDDPILATHGTHFAAVSVPSAPAGETASTAVPRAPAPKRAAARKTAEPKKSE